MKKSDALSILRLADGASDDEIKRAHRKLVIENHPDKFGQDEAARAEAEEKTKLINEARDVLLNRTWDPESRTAGTPYGAPYRYQPYRAQGQDSPAGASPFDGFPFSEQFVWTTWDAAGHRTTYTASGSTSAGAGAPGSNPFSRPAGNGGAWPFAGADPFSAFFDAFFGPEPTLEERLEEERKALRFDAGLIAAKLAVLAVCLVLGVPATGLYLYTIGSLGQGVWKRLGKASTLVVLPFVIIALVLVPVSGTHVGIFAGLLFACALGFDWRNVRLHREKIKLIERALER